LLPTTIPAYSQNSWATFLPDAEIAVKMLKTGDGNYLTLSKSGYQDEFYLHKLDPDGNILWEKSFEPDTGQFSTLRIIELSDSKLFICGWENGKPFSMLCSSQGDSIWHHRYDSFVIGSGYSGCQFYYPVEYSENGVMLLSGCGPYYLTKISLLDGDITASDSIYHINHLSKTSDPAKFLAIEFSPSQYGYNDYYIIDTNFNIVSHRNLKFIPGLFTDYRENTIKVDPVSNNYYMYGMQFGSQAGEPYYSGFIIFNQQLDSIGFIEDTDYCPYLNWLIGLTVHDFAFTSDDMIALTGSVYYNQMSHVVLVKCTKDGTPVINIIYDDISMKYGESILEDNGAFVMLQDRLEAPYWSFVVKTNSDGTVSSPIINQSSDKGVSLSPNPVSDILVLGNLKNEGWNIEIYDSLSQQCLRVKISNTDEYSLDISNLISGQYFIKCTNDKKTFVYKIIKL